MFENADEEVLSQLDGAMRSIKEGIEVGPTDDGLIVGGELFRPVQVDIEEDGQSDDITKGRMPDE